MIETVGLFDWVRVVNLILCVLAFVVLLIGFFQFHREYNEKTRDYWYGRLIWCLVGAFISFEGIRQDLPFNVIPLLVFIATLVTLKGMLQKGPWGYHK